MLESQGIHISMDGKGGWRDKVFVERLWRSIKYAELGYDNVIAAKAGITRYPGCYNCRRPHQSFDGQAPPAAVMTSMRCDWHKGAYCTLGGGS